MANTQPLPYHPRILIIEDERITAQHLRRTLMKLGYDIVGLAATGAEAAEKADQTCPDLLLVDIGLEGTIDGIEVASQMRERHNIPTVFLTAYTDRETMARARITEPYGYLVKPFAEQELHATIEIALQQRRLAHQRKQQTERDAKVLEQTREELAVLAGRLFSAQEEERQRIARDLHDDMVQRLALLQMNLEGISRQIHDECSEPTRKLFAPLAGQVEELTTSLRDLSHTLHPSVLDHLGLIAAVKQMAREFQNREGIKTRVAVRNVPGTLPNTISICLYRIVQEALRNVAQHANASSISIALVGTANTIHLTVRDTGTGFDLATARKGGTLGLISMAQRAELIGGTLDVISDADKGTQIHVQAPLLH